MKNLVGVENDPDQLRLAERALTGARFSDVHEVVSGAFDERHLRDLHHHIFQDVYEWAGTMRSDTITLEGEEIRVPDVTGDFGKADSSFMSSAYVDRGLAHVAELANSEGALSSDREVFAEAATEVLSNLNYVHPFREGNGRTQRAFMEQLAERAGHNLNFSGVTGERNDAASVAAHGGDNEQLHRIISESLDPERVALRREAIAGLEQSGVEADSFWVETPEPGDRVQGTYLDHKGSHVTIVTEENHIIALPPEALDGSVQRGDQVDFRYGRASAAEDLSHGDPGGLSGGSGEAASGGPLDAQSRALIESFRDAWEEVQAVEDQGERAELEARIFEEIGKLPDDLHEQVAAAMLPDRSAGSDDDYGL
ncbi:hypothetical protein DL1_20395 [Thioclava dalianensis]|uniref:protein adenylyltransferase n=1 Tax=Thioclava dalianensis TaxID=1185766 RepID=A0A074T7Y5_9RHOB|nr:Fic family protein [Thioclava dalianensis]KEP67799.1 hypothetical protein DL1_20395 [Thioclava dalianensis]SFN95701.1 cell filamentation protein [Thioclava dalianensis]